MITFQEEKLDSFIPDATLALAEYEKELPLPYPINPDWDQYKAIEGAGLLLVITARDDGKLAGYFVVIISPNITCAGEKMAFGATLYLKKEYRSGTFAGLKLIRMAEQKAQEYNCATIMISSPAIQPIDKFLKRKGYSETETLFSRRL